MGTWLAFALVLRERVVRPLQTLSNMLAALREQDYSLRARRHNAEDALGLVMFELNILTDELKERRLGALEATALLQRVMAEIDVAVFAFDQDAGPAPGERQRRASARPSRRSGCWVAAPTSWGSARVSRATRHASSSSASRRRADAGRCAAARSARAAGRTSSSCSPT